MSSLIPSSWSTCHAARGNLGAYYNPVHNTHSASIINFGRFLSQTRVSVLALMHGHRGVQGHRSDSVRSSIQVNHGNPLREQTRPLPEAQQTDRLKLSRLLHHLVGPPMNSNGTSVSASTYITFSAFLFRPSVGDRFKDVPKVVICEPIYVSMPLDIYLARVTAPRRSIAFAGGGSKGEQIGRLILRRAAQPSFGVNSLIIKFPSLSPGGKVHARH